MNRENMKYVYEDRNGKLKSAIDPIMCFLMIGITLTIPILAFFQMLSHLFLEDAKWVSKYEYHKHMMNYYKNKRKEVK